MLPLDRYLNQARDEGTFQSEGQFTLSTQESLKKLSTFQFDPPGLWLVKVVQCAVALKAQRMEIKVTRSNLQVSFDGEIGLSARELLEALTHPPERTTPALSHLLSGLRALYGQKPGLVWRCSSERGASVLSVSAAGIREWESSETGARFELIVERPFHLNRPLFSRWLGWTLDELETVRERCWLAPLEIILDGRPLRVASHPAVRTLARWEVSSDESLPTTMWARSEENATLSVPRNPGGVAWNPVPKKERCYLDRRLKPESRVTPIGSLLTLEQRSGAKSRVYYVAHGALVKGPLLKFRLPDNLAVRYYVGMDGVKVDLSGFRTEEHHPELLAQSYPELRDMVKLFAALLGDKDEVEKAEANPTAAGIGSGLVTAAGFLKAAPLVFGLVGLPTSLVIGGGVMTVSKMAKQKRALDRLDLANALRTLKRQIPHVLL